MASHHSVFHTCVGVTAGSYGAGKSGSLPSVCGPAHWQRSSSVPIALRHAVCSQQDGKGWVGLDQALLLQQGVEA